MAVISEQMEKYSAERAERQAVIKRDRRYRLLAVNAEYFVAVMLKHAEVVAGLPPDAFVGRISYDLVSDDLLVQIFSQDFEIVPDYHPAPRMDVLLRTRQ